MDNVDAVFIEGQDVTPVNLMTSDGEITCMMETELVELIKETGRRRVRLSMKCLLNVSGLV